MYLKCYCITETEPALKRVPAHATAPTHRLEPRVAGGYQREDTKGRIQKGGYKSEDTKARIQKEGGRNCEKEIENG